MMRSLGHNFCYASDVEYEPPEVVKDALRGFGEGLKVCAEIVLIATEAGFIKPGEGVIAMGGREGLDARREGAWTRP